MTREQLEKFKNGKALIDMKNTDEFDWLDLVDECMEVGIDLNARAEAYYKDRIEAMSGKENVFHSVPPFIYYQHEWNKRFHLLKCEKDNPPRIISSGSNSFYLEVYKYERGIPPVFEV